MLYGAAAYSNKPVDDSASVLSAAIHYVVNVDSDAEKWWPRTFPALL